MVQDPKLQLSYLDVEPAVNAALVSSAKDPREGRVRIQTFSRMTFFPSDHSWDGR